MLRIFAQIKLEIPDWFLFKDLLWLSIADMQLFKRLCLSGRRSICQFIKSQKVELRFRCFLRVLCMRGGEVGSRGGWVEGRLGRRQGHPTPDIVTLHHLFPTFSESVKKWPIKHEHYPKTTITFFHSLTLTLDSSMDLNIYFWGLIRVFVHLLFEQWPWREQNSVKHWGTFDRLPVFGQRPWRGRSYVEHRGVLFVRLFVPPKALRPEIYSLRAEICPLRPKICPLRPKICPLRPEICPRRFKAWEGRF